MAQRVIASARKVSLFTGLPKANRNYILNTTFNQSSQQTIGSHVSNHIRLLTTTPSRLSIMEFFDDPKNYGAEKVRSGRSWRIDELRLKSNSDLHKLWFVLYKERNMLYTMQEAAREEAEVFPSPERIDKVEESMANLENVVRERNKAYWQLEVSPCASGERQRSFRRNALGIPKWISCSQHLVPYHRNSKWKLFNGPAHLTDTNNSWFFTRYREMQRRIYNARRSKTARNIRHMFRRFPNADVDYIAELHPEFPEGYIKHLKENLVLYDDPPTKADELNLNQSVQKLLGHREDKLLQ